jgi:hypothetical protein
VKAAFGVPDTVMVQMRTGRSIPISVEALPGHEFQGTDQLYRGGGGFGNPFVPGGNLDSESRSRVEAGMIASLSLEDARPVAGGSRDSLRRGGSRPGSPADFAVMVVEGKIAKARRVAWVRRSASCSR